MYRRYKHALTLSDETFCALIYPDTLHWTKWSIEIYNIDNADAYESLRHMVWPLGSFATLTTRSIPLSISSPKKNISPTRILLLHSCQTLQSLHTIAASSIILNSIIYRQFSYYYHFFKSLFIADLTKENVDASHFWDLTEFVRHLVLFFELFPNVHLVHISPVHPLICHFF